MIIKKIDFLSPSITFYYKGAQSHSSILSGILSIISIIIIIIFAVYFFLEIIERKNPKGYYYNTFVDDVGEYPINSSSFFHYISMYEESSNKIDKGINFTYFRIIGLDTYYHYYLRDKNITKFNHWLYGYCNNGSDIQGIEDLIKEDDFYKSACIKKYFDSSDQRYYLVGDRKFRWPIIAHGTYHPNKTFYSVIVEKCKEETIGNILGDNYHCSNEDEMNQLFSLRGAFHFYFLDSYVDLLNFTHPNTKYFYRVENGIDKDNYSVNHININPTTIKTNKGLLFDNIIEEYGYNYDRNDVMTYSTGIDNIYMAYYLWLSNRMFFYERTYKKVQEVISNIGGIIEVVYFLALMINNLYNNYITFCDTRRLLFSSIEKEKKLERKNNLLYYLNKRQKTNQTDKYNKNKGNYKKGEKISNKNSKNEILCSKKNSTEVKYDDANDNSRSIIKDNNKDNKKEEIKQTQNKRFFTYLLFKISFGKRYKSFKKIEDFRMRIISEEHLIKNHLNIYNLVKVAEKKKRFVRNSYRITDLINLV